MKISKKGLYALQALMSLTRHYAEGAIKIREIAAEEEVPEKFLELILHELKVARFVDSERGAHGGYRLKRAPGQIFLGDVIRTLDGPLAPFGVAARDQALVWLLDRAYDWPDGAMTASPPQVTGGKDSKTKCAGPNRS